VKRTVFIQECSRRGFPGKAGRSGGFTLIEMLLVVIILSVLAAMLMPRFTGRSEEAKRAAAAADVQANIASALDLYELDNGDYPTTAQGLQALIAMPVGEAAPRAWKGPYLKRKKGLKDPWGRPYVFRFPGHKNPDDYDLFSVGPDGTEGNEDDVVNWDEGGDE